MAALQLNNITKTIGSVPIIRGIDLSIASGEFIVFVGPSGCGKSTLLRLIAGLDDVSGGDLLLDGEKVNDWPPVKRGVAMVFQSYALYPHMSVRQNMAFGLTLARADRATIDARVQEAARILKIDHLLDRKPRELSGGQRQRVAIGRAITRQPKIFLFDEPLSNLDAALRTEMRIEIAKLHHAQPATMIYVTHDQHEAMTLADRIVVLDGGRVRQVGAPLELYQRPADQFVAGFIGSPRMNFLPVALIAPSLPQDMKLSQAIQTVGIRPENFTLADDNTERGLDDQRLAGHVLALDQLGTENYLYVDLGQEAPCTVKLPSGVIPSIGARVTLRPDPTACHFFDNDGTAVR